ncbi:uncharacterized protein [Blastocystis hominis]|uniref:Uncharacterized protein n=1 Tax=Blastocystis hominis TaxID=12968 RepID=D8LZ39_BLAHO|nr:uncharacterized protein [Blastocystis hominis]CBK21078.2 unnamed protein product [Blastocystis hominis]|eukprot:XP_012895126.1 uncharacterized protein [Blastocystis hominis]
MSGRGDNTVRNRDPAPIQITAEQLLRDTKERQSSEVKTPIQKIQNSEELAEWRFLQRRHFEEGIKNQRQHMGNYIKYTKWEEKQDEIERSRNIYERALDVDPTAYSVWIKYAEFEVRNRNINHARNVYDRAVTILPRVDQLW